MVVPCILEDSYPKEKAEKARVDYVQRKIYNINTFKDFSSVEWRVVPTDSC